MTDPSQNRALANYRQRLDERGMARFEVLALGANRVREAVSETLSGSAPTKGGILAALRRSPMVGADLDLDRHFEGVKTLDPMRRAP